MNLKDMPNLGSIQPSAAAIQYDIMPDNYFAGILSARSGFFKGKLVFHFNANQDVLNRIANECSKSSIRITDMYKEMPELIPNMDYRYAFSIPQIQYIDQTELLHEILKG
jgi:hypothetical protein